MRRSFVFVFAAAVFALALFLSSFTTRTVSSADIHEKCNDCLVRAQRQYEQCVQQHGETSDFCGLKSNEDIVHCYRNFCEQ
jgi:hypothetical protein